ncbi:hypothetical protein FA048_10085 [Pedobacter polaris]|uniref:Uncharacterized protein n=1 Tax=Pedobacter polaris TaxID=2571273 RepID=A0A4U1CS42_9SPHI|nr:hypothetical protein [Pedobacter polaris]TKC10523.1 hypothetical protein FA048_10085 [Pedobacter polaris]
MIRPRLERYRKYFLNHFDNYVLAAEFDLKKNLVVYATPYQDFDEIVIEICEGLVDTVDFSDHVLLYLYPFGSNKYIKIAINPTN